MVRRLLKTTLWFMTMDNGQILRSRAHGTKFGSNREKVDLSPSAIRMLRQIVPEGRISLRVSTRPPKADSRFKCLALLFDRNMPFATLNFRCVDVVWVDGKPKLSHHRHEDIVLCASGLMDLGLPDEYLRLGNSSSMPCPGSRLWGYMGLFVQVKLPTTKEVSIG